MSEIKLFRIVSGIANEMQGVASDLEKPLQTLIEKNLDELLAVRFLATEYSTGKTHAGRIDTLGIDENNCPVILEYKRSTGENVINQGLFYLDWLMDHKAEFTLLTMKQYGQAVADSVDWSARRLICVAADFTKYDAHAVQQMNRNIELIRYRQFGHELMLLELVNATTAAATSGKVKATLGNNKSQGADKTVAQWLAGMPPLVGELFATLEGYLTSLGDDVQRKDLKLYVAFKRIKNFATVVFQKDRLIVYVQLNPAQIVLQEGFTRDVREIGHWGTGDLELCITSHKHLDEAKPFLEMAYVGGKGAV